MKIEKVHIQAIKENAQVKDLFDSIKTNEKQYKIFSSICLDWLNIDFIINLILILFIKYEGNKNTDWVDAIHRLGNSLEYSMLSDEIVVDEKRFKTVMDTLVKTTEYVNLCGKEKVTGMTKKEINLLFSYLFKVYNSIFEVD